MNEIANNVVPLVVGLTLGAIFFGGLWWTIRNGLTSAHPASWFLVSHVSRMTVTLVGFYFVADGQWQRVLLCLAGFLFARIVVTRLTAPVAKLAESFDPATNSENLCDSRYQEEIEHASQSR
ncbi:ATP synthase subunit I [Novipirellula sp. SH528]|uniref:N-ATPase subunit AtpR n=1 Tax=Novipirellula sp. SH528 TaxID=3454466 RepID=UPI003F9F627A